MYKLLTIADLIAASDLPRTRVKDWNTLRLQSFEVVQKVYDDRVEAYDVDHPPYEELIYGPVSFATELYKRVRRLASLLSPLRKDPIRVKDLNRMIDICVDCMNYFSWLYGMLIIASEHFGNEDSDDAPNYLEDFKNE